MFKRTYLKKSRTPFTPDIILLEAPDRARFVMKDISTRPLPVRLFWGRQSMSREIEAYRKMTGLAGVPQLISQLDQDGFIMEWIDAEPLPSRQRRDELGLEFFQKLDQLVEAMHSRGVAHGDLRRRNILKTSTGTPCVIDFETAVRGGVLFKPICTVDCITILKIRGRYFPESMTDTDKQRLKNAPWHLKAGRFLRKKVYGPLSAKGWRKRRRRS